MTARIYASVAGAVALFIGVFFISGEARLRLNGVTVEATLEGRGSRCSLQYQIPGDPAARYNTLECPDALAFARRADFSDVKMSSIDYASFRYTDAEGVVRHSERASSTLPADMPVGGHFPVVYNPARPDVAEAPLTLGMAAMLALAPAIGIGAMLFGLGLFGGTRLPASARRVAMARR